MTCDIHRARDGKSYEMLVDGKFAGNFDTVAEAAKEYDQMELRESCERAATDEEGTV